jgi:hypothetical protein
MENQGAAKRVEILVIDDDPSVVNGLVRLLRAYSTPKLPPIPGESCH